jgi:hypothetical protein
VHCVYKFNPTAPFGIPHWKIDTWKCGLSTGWPSPKFTPMMTVFCLVMVHRSLKILTTGSSLVVIGWVYDGPSGHSNLRCSKFKKWGSDAKGKTKIVIYKWKYVLKCFTAKTIWLYSQYFALWFNFHLCDFCHAKFIVAFKGIYDMSFALLVIQIFIQFNILLYVFMWSSPLSLVNFVYKWRSISLSSWQVFPWASWSLTTQSNGLTTRIHGVCFD